METDRARHERWFRRALAAKGVLHFPPGGWPGWTPEEIAQKRRELMETIQDVSVNTPLDVEEREDGTLVVRALAAFN